jgi:tetratricopeptide (TPR) repeat protein
MSPAREGDDEELVDIDVDVDADLPSRLSPPSANGAPEPVSNDDTEPNRVSSAAEPPPAEPPAPELLDIVDVVELRPPIVEAADDEPRAEIELYRGEAAAADGGRRAGLLIEVARLEERIAGEEGRPGEEALTSARAAFAADPASIVAFWMLRRLLVRGGRWAELAEVHAEAARARPAGGDPAVRADLLVARGRLLEDRLERGEEAVAAYREALGGAADHAGALISLWLAGVRRADAGLRAEALAGLARLDRGAARRAALVIEESRAWRAARADGPARALAALEGELARQDQDAPLAALLTELDGLTRAGAPADVADRALALLADRVARAEIDARLAVALLRERAYLLRRHHSRPQAALEALDEAARIDPGHPVLAAERIELALALDRGQDAADIARAFVAAATRDDDAVDIALLFAELSSRLDAAAEARALLDEPRVRACRAARPDLRAVLLALAVRNHDAAALADAFAGEAEIAGDADVAAYVHAVQAAAAVLAGALGDAEQGAELYRQALARDPALRFARPAVQALASISIAAGRIEEAAGILERGLEAITADPSRGGAEADRWMREQLVALYADELGQPGRALPHQRRLAAQRPKHVAPRVRLLDLDLQARPEERLPPVERAGHLLTLADAARDTDVAIALRIAAGRALAVSGDAVAAERGAAILRDLVGADPAGLAGSALERTCATPPDRAQVVANELSAAGGATAERERERALRFRLAHHRASVGAYAEALAALTPLRSEGDPIARAWSYQLARQSGEAILEIAVLSEEARLSDGTVSDPANVLLAHGEALARAGDPTGAADAFRRAIVEAPIGETAPAAALGLFRLAAGERAIDRGALGEALTALGQACADDPAVAAAAGREGALSSLAAGIAVAGPADLGEMDPAARADTIVWRLLAGIRGQEGAAVADALVAVASGLESEQRGATPETLGLAARAAARARLGGAAAAERVAAELWQRGRSPAMAAAVSDLPVPAGQPWPASRPDPRRARARRVGGALGIALHLEAALDAERAGDLPAALAAYSSVISADPRRLEAWSGIRRVARAAGDTLGEARALARLGALIRDPHRAAALLVDAGTAYELAGRADDAIAALSRAVELDPESPQAFEQAYRLLRSDLAAPGRAEILDGLLSYRLAAGRPAPQERIALLFERAQGRLNLEGGRDAAISDFKQILKIDPESVEAMRELWQAATAAGDRVMAAHWLERYLPRAVAALRRVAEDTPGDPAPLDQLGELLADHGDPAGAIQAFRAALARVPDLAGQGARWVRVGEILRDQVRDGAGAVSAFRQAADVDPLGPGVAAMVALYDGAGDGRGALQIVEREIADLRRILAAAPLDLARLTRLQEWVADARRRGGQPGGEAAVSAVRALATGGPLPPAPVPAAPLNGRALLAAIADPAAGGFAAEIWPLLAGVAEVLFPPPPGNQLLAGPPAAALGWVESVAAALDIPRLDLLARAGTTGPVATPIDRAPPALLLDPNAPADARTFFAARAVGLLALRAGVLDGTSAEDIAPLFSCAAVLAGGAVPKRLPKPSDALLRDVGRLMDRKDRKALALQASRFGFEPLDLESWRLAVLRVADRFALLVTGDPARAAIVTAGGRGVVAGSPAALGLLGFALSDTYAAARRAAGYEEGT